MDRISLPSDAFRLGHLTVAPSLNRILYEGRGRDVEPRVMAVLAALAQTPGEVVTRAELFEAVWPDTVVGDEALTRAVSELRKALADGAPDAIETIRGTGYRLVLPIEPVIPPAPASQTPRREGEMSAEVTRSRRSGRPATLALVVAGVALVVAVWAAWPRVARSPEADPPPNAATPQMDGPDERGEPYRLDSTSPYFREGLSELGVYYDSSTGNYFSFDTTRTE